MRNRAVVGVVLYLASVSPAATAAQRAPTAISLLESSYVRIGSITGPPESTFAGVVAAIRLRSGEIVVADRGNHTISFFDASGRHIRSFGGEGRGPGEFKGLTWIGECTEGELLAVDPVISRGTILSTVNAKLVRTFDLPPDILFNPYLACENDGRLVVMLNRPRAAGEGGQIKRCPSAVVVLVPQSTSRDTLLRLPGTDYYFAARVAGYSPLPLGTQSMSASRGGWVYAAQNTDEIIHAVNLRTGLRTSFRHELPRPRITSGAWRAAKARLIQQQALRETQQLLSRVLAEVRSPKMHPPFMDMKADARGRLWLRLPSYAPSVIWRVYEPNGRLTGSVRLPSTLDLLDIGDSHIIAIERDALDVQTLRVYLFARPLLASAELSGSGHKKAWTRGARHLQSARPARPRAHLGAPAETLQTRPETLARSAVTVYCWPSRAGVAERGRHRVVTSAD